MREWVLMNGCFWGLFSFLQDGRNKHARHGRENKLARLFNLSQLVSGSQKKSLKYIQY